MKRRKSPWFAFYVDDYSGGTRTMSLAAKGAFVDLLGYQFQNGSVPDSDKLICRILGCLPDEWAAVEEEVRAKFYGIDGALVNHRMEGERSEREGYREKAAANGRKGGRPKKTEPFPNGNRTLSENETQKKASTSTSTSTSSSPEESSAVAADSLRFAGEDEQQQQQVLQPFDTPSLADAMKQVGRTAYALSAEMVEKWHCDREALGWQKHDLPIRNWKADLKSYALSWKSNRDKEKTFK